MTKVTAKDPAAKIAHRRLSVLELSQELGSVSKAMPPGRHGPDQLL